MKRIALMLALLVAIGCKAQAPSATTHVVELNWTAPLPTTTWAGCTTALPCVYAVFGETIPIGTTTCDVSSSTNWHELTVAGSRPSGTTYTDTTATGLNRCYLVETVQGSAYSGPSNIINQQVPSSPLPPALNSPTIAQVGSPDVHPALRDSAPEMAYNNHVGTVRLTSRLR